MVLILDPCFSKNGPGFFSVDAGNKRCYIITEGILNSEITERLIAEVNLDDNTIEFCENPRSEDKLMIVIEHVDVDMKIIFRDEVYYVVIHYKMIK